MEGHELKGHYQMPAEWAAHEATLLTWPHRAEVWRGVLDEVEDTFTTLARWLSNSEKVLINIPEGDMKRLEARLQRGGVNMAHIDLLPIDSDDVWARDHGPTVVCARPGFSGPKRVMIDWDFNAWGGKYAFELDAAVVGKLCARLGWERFSPGLVMEGGALEVNGAGDLLTTESVLLNPNRNPSFNQETLTKALCDTLGVEQVLWLGDGLEGDDTDGHIDDIARFVSTERVLVVRPPDGHPDAGAMLANIDRLKGFRASKTQQPFEVLTLPSPTPIHFMGEHLPASYANFYIANRCVLVPIFEQRTDAEALSLIRDCFPSREVVGVDCRALVSQYGAIHCVTQQIPAV